RRVAALVDEDLAGLCLAAQPRSHDHDRPDRPVVVTTFEADPSEGRVPDRHADPEAKLVAALGPGLVHGAETVAHGHGHAHGPSLVIRLLDRVVEEDEDAVTREVLQRAPELHD